LQVVHVESAVTSVSHWKCLWTENLSDVHQEVFMERLYNKFGLPIKCYPRRGMLLVKLMICVLLNDLHYSQSWGNGFPRK
jgi:hypothetical protein